MSSNPDALVKFWQEASKAIGSDLLLGGIYADKRGYHNRRDNLPSTDYSVKLAADKRGPADKASAIDLTFKTAQKSDFRNIAKYSTRLYNGMKNRDKRLFWRGDTNRPVIREFFGNIDLDRDVEGWTFSNSKTGKAGPASSDSSHLWHIHISFHREFCDNWEAASGVLDVLLGRPIEDEDEVTPQDKKDIAKLVIDGLLASQLDPGDFAERIGGWDDETKLSYGGLLVGSNAWPKQVDRKVDALARAVAALADGMSPSVKRNVETSLKEAK